MVSIRGAIVIEENSKDCIINRTRELLNKIIEGNNINIEEITSILFSATKDITAAYPAIAARDLGIVNAGLLCFQEMYVENSLKMCIRILMNVDNTKKQKDVKHIYLNGAEILRPDLKS